MKSSYLAGAILLAAAFQSLPLSAADEFKQNESPEIFQKNFEAAAHVERAYEIGTSTFTLTAQCQNSEADAKKAVEKKVAEIQGLVDQAIKTHKLGDKTAFAGYDLAQPIAVYAGSPIEQPNSQNGWNWVDTCSGKTSKSLLREKSKYTAQKSVSVWFPNKEKLLSHLSSLVGQIDKLSENPLTGTEVKCDRVAMGGADFRLGVTKATEEEAWKEVETKARALANQKKMDDLIAGRYDNEWPMKEYFAKGESTRVPAPSVSKEGGRWIAKVADEKQFTVYVKQPSSPESRGSEVLSSTLPPYSVSVQETAHEGIYGDLSISISKNCMADADAAKEAVAKVATPLLDRLRAINQGRNSESDRMDVAGDAAAYEVSPWRLYRQAYKQDGESTRYYYNACTTDLQDGTKEPASKVFEGRMSVRIRSSDLDALTKVRDELNETYKVDIDDPNLLRVTTSWSATLVLPELERLAGKLETRALQQFLDQKSEFRCEVGRYSFACMSTPAKSSFDSRTFEGGRANLESAPGASPAYQDKAATMVDASERGMATFHGKYVMPYTLRKVLK